MPAPNGRLVAERTQFALGFDLVRCRKDGSGRIWLVCLRVRAGRDACLNHRTMLAEIAERMMVERWQQREDARQDQQHGRDGLLSVRNQRQ